MTCSICRDKVGKDGEMIYLSLYCSGSEGIDVCLSCRIALTEYARSMMRIAGKCFFNGYRAAREIHIQKGKDGEQRK